MNYKTLILHHRKQIKKERKITESERDTRSMDTEAESAAGSDLGTEILN